MGSARAVRIVSTRGTMDAYETSHDHYACPRSAAAPPVAVRILYICVAKSRSVSQFRVNFDRTRILLCSSSMTAAGEGMHVK